ncbi:MAG: hypothetical protein Q8T09_06770 [Candidatus Melainabacteria bacterium]|nr:hypothetical protein [Candidatus Melainabacteria bacterium]
MPDQPQSCSGRSTIDDIQNLSSRTSNVEVEKLAHYSVITLPIELLRTDQENTIEVTAHTPLTIFGQKLQAEEGFRLIPARSILA